MEKIFIFYGPNREYNKYIPETYFLLDTLIEVSDLNKKSRFSMEANIVAQLSRQKSKIFIMN